VAKAHALLRAGFPYLRTVGMRRVTSYPTDLALGDDDVLFVVCRTEIAASVRRLSQDDEDLGTIGSFLWPQCIVRGPDGHFYVSDEGKHTVTVLTAEGDVVREWGEQGSEPGQLDRPSGLAFDGEGNLLVADTGNHRIQRFTPEGQPLGGWGGHGTEPGQFDMPWGLTIDDEGDVFVADWRNDRVQKLSAEGEPLLVIGGSGDGDGEFNRPAGVAVDEHGDIYVADRGNDRVQLFAHTGRYVQQFRGDATLSAIGRRYILANQKTLRLREMANLEEQRLLRAPCSVRVDGQGLMYVPDLGSHRVQVYQKEAYVLEPDEIMPPLSAPTLFTT
jgi:DNA-binding beta-propeller fold protein YncE